MVHELVKKREFEDFPGSCLPTLLRVKKKEYGLGTKRQDLQKEMYCRGRSVVLFHPR